jgi:hypothetical protein
MADFKLDNAAHGPATDRGTNVAFHYYYAVTRAFFHPIRSRDGPHLSSRSVRATTYFERPNMTDDKTKKAADGRRINLHQAYELGYWSRKFGVSEQEVAEAVQTAGPMASDVERELQK